jgi:Zinc-finger double-stranded RNA-binding
MAPPRSTTLPSASTASARAARAAFFCDLCQKQYTRQNELEAHESSYDHLHKKRLKEMKSLQGKMAQPRREREGSGVVMSIKLGGGKDGKGGGGGGFKKGGFKNAFAPVEGGGDGDGGEEDGKKVGGEREGERFEAEAEEVGGQVDSDVTDEEDYYDPRRPTGCMPGCPGRGGMGNG